MHVQQNPRILWTYGRPSKALLSTELGEEWQTRPHSPQLPAQFRGTLARAAQLPRFGWRTLRHAAASVAAWMPLAPAGPSLASGMTHLLRGKKRQRGHRRSDSPRLHGGALSVAAPWRWRWARRRQKWPKSSEPRGLARQLRRSARGGHTCASGAPHAGRWLASAAHCPSPLPPATVMPGPRPSCSPATCSVPSAGSGRPATSIASTQPWCSWAAPLTRARTRRLGPTLPARRQVRTGDAAGPSGAGRGETIGWLGREVGR